MIQRFNIKANVPVVIDRQISFARLITASDDVKIEVMDGSSNGEVATLREGWSYKFAQVSSQTYITSRTPQEIEIVLALGEYESDEVAGTVRVRPAAGLYSVSDYEFGAGEKLEIVPADTTRKRVWIESDFDGRVGGEDINSDAGRKLKAQSEIELQTTAAIFAYSESGGKLSVLIESEIAPENGVYESGVYYSGVYK